MKRRVWGPGPAPRNVECQTSNFLNSGDFYASIYGGNGFKFVKIKVLVTFF